MSVHTAEISPPQATSAGLTRHARAAGVLFLILLVCGPFSMLYVPATLIVSGDAAATADNVAANQSLLDAAIVCDVLVFLTEILMAAVLYTLFRAVSPTISMAAAFARLGQAGIMAVNLLGYLVVALLVGSAGFLAAFDTDQVNALVLLTLQAHEYGIYIGQTFFGTHLLLLGYLISRSGYVPRVFGWLVAVTAAGYLADSIGNFVFPEATGTLGVIVGVTSVIGELPFFLWLLFKGIRVRESTR
jgi:hypothetical protein